MHILVCREAVNGTSRPVKRRRRQSVFRSDLLRNRAGARRVNMEGCVMADIDLETLRARIRSMAFERGTPEQIALWREDIEEARANLVIEDMVPTDDEDAMFALMLDEGVPPALMPSIILGFYKPGTGQIAA
jgi:hypothetical protein